MADRVIMPRALNDNGEVVAGAKAYFYEAGTTNPLTVFSDSAGTVPITAPPLLADATGTFSAVFTTSPVKLDIKDASDVSLPGFPSDPAYTSPADAVGASAVAFSPITGNTATTVQAAIQNLTTLWNAVTTYGKSLVAAANAADARTVLGLGGLSLVDILDEDDMATDSATRPPSQQSTKAYVDGKSFVTTETAAAASGQTEIDFTGIPATVKNIVVHFNGVSMSGTDNIIVQLGDAGGFETSGYNSGSTVSSTAVTSTAGLIIQMAAASNEGSGQMHISFMGSNTWTSHHGVFRSVGNTVEGGGSKALSDVLTQVRVTRTGTDTFDAGTINVSYW